MTDDASDDPTPPEAARDATDITRSAVSTDYKVRGKKDAPGGAGVVGHNTASSGVSYGVEGVTDSIDTGAAGVRGEATKADSATYGVHGETEAAETGAAALRGDTTSGAQALRARGKQARGGYVSTHTQGYKGLIGSNEAGSGAGTGIYGYTNTPGAGSIAVRGNAAANSGKTYGVKGETQSSSSDASGVFGTAGATSGYIFGVNGVTDSRGGIGVRGKATATSGDADGMSGFTDAPGYLEDVVTHLASRYATGVSGWANSTSGALYTAGVRGVNGNSSGNAYGVYGKNTATSGSAAHGVVGTTASSDTGAAGVVGDGTGGENAAVRAEGRLEVTDWGAAVSPGSGSAQSISNATTTKVDFDTVEKDPQSEFDTSNNEFSPAVGGDYRVEAQVLWKNCSVGTHFQIFIYVSDSLVAHHHKFSGGDLESQRISKVIPGLSSSDTVAVKVYHDEGSSLGIDDDSDDTYASFVRVG